MGALASRPMPLGFRWRTESEAVLPEGGTRIAQRFNVGIESKEAKVPKGTAESWGTLI